MSRSTPQRLVFSYHKSGTSLFFHVMTKVAARLGLTLENRYGLVRQLNPAAGIVLLPHSLLAASIDWPYRAIRLIRDPRDIWVSGYLYHRRSTEEWCVNTDFDPTPPVGYPRVDHSVAHRAEAWKWDYLKRLNGKSYRLNLLERSREDGLDFELEGYTGWTMVAMRAWNDMGVTALDVKLEDAMADFDGTMARIFAYFGFSPDEARDAMDVARTEDIRRMDDAAMAERPQIHSRDISKWRGFLPPAHIARFEAAYGDVIQALGYELTAAEHEAAVSDGMSAGLPSLGTFRPPEIPRTDIIPNSRRYREDIRLTADGAIINSARPGTETLDFVVPAGTRIVCLETRETAAGGPSDDRNNSDPGPRIRKIVVRSGWDEIAIFADDPRLSDGWHAVERDDVEIWRRPNGIAGIPWRVFPRAATVTVHIARATDRPV